MFSRLLHHFPRQQWRFFHKASLITQFHATARYAVVKPVLMTDIGEGITECEIIQWFVEPGTQVEEWDKLCEVTSDKASVEITSRFTGVVKKLHYDVGEMAKVGNPIVDIDIQGTEDKETIAQTVVPDPTEENLKGQSEENIQPKSTKANSDSQLGLASSERNIKLATPAVRSLAKQLDVQIENVPGTGKDERVLREDVYQYLKKRDISNSNVTISSPVGDHLDDYSTQKETIQPLTSSQNLMFKAMTKSLSIPYFLYADEIDFTFISKLRGRLNTSLAKNAIGESLKLSFLPFIIKAMSMALQQYPILNAKIEHNEATSKPSIMLRSQHNIGVAMDTPAGLLVPVVKNVSSLNVASIASELAHLRNLASSGKLTSRELSGGTITVSNIGSIGGTYVSPVVIENQLVILGVGKMRTLPAFSAAGELVKKEVCNFSWSADHRIIDGATMARASEVMRGYIEDPESMILHLR